jgi:hypothetical protein
MDRMLEFAVDIIPSLIFAFVIIYIFHETLRFLKQRGVEEKQVTHAAVKPNATNRSSETVTSLELQAAERFALYLERIAPDRLVMRIHQNGMSSKMLQAEMLRTIREEFDHNLSQQIYISEGAWELIRNAKDEMIKFISAIGDSMPGNSTGIDLSRKLFEAASRV